MFPLRIKIDGRLVILLVLVTRCSVQLICTPNYEISKQCEYKKAGHCIIISPFPINNSRPLYFARVDIKSCFDTIEQEKLLNIVYHVISSDEYVLHKYCELNMDQGNVRKRFNIRACAMGTLFKVWY